LVAAVIAIIIIVQAWSIRERKGKEIMREERHLVKILLLCAGSFFGGNLRQSSAAA
jgi:hypothetical protein